MSLLNLEAVDLNAPTYLAVVNTSGRGAHLMHDAARPWAVVNVNTATKHINFVMARYTTKRGAAIACGKANARR